MKSKLDSNSRADARLQICDANIVTPSAGFEPLLSDIYSNTACNVQRSRPLGQLGFKNTAFVNRVILSRK